jgi:hypothetical protein
MGVMPESGVLPPLPRPIGPAKARTLKMIKRCDITTDDAKPDVEPAVHHPDDAGNYLQVCNFSNFIKILLNYVPNDFL